MSSKLNPHKTFAILMGSSRFKKGFSPIPPVKNNLRDLKQLLMDEAILGLQSERIRVIEDETSNDAVDLLMEYAHEAKEAKASTLLFYYAGHGYKRTDGKYFLTGTDSDTKLINLDGSSGISFDGAIEKVLRQTNIPQHIIILDACSSGTVALSEGEALPDIDLKGSYTLTSSAHGQDSLFDEALLPHTFFTAELIEALRMGIPNEKETITLAELHGYLAQRMKAQGYAMSPRQRTTNELQAHAYTFCKNKAFDGEKKYVAELAAEIQDALNDMEAGAISKAKRNLKGILEEIEEKLTRDSYKTPLFQKVQGYLTFCEHYTNYKPIFEKILGGDQSAALAAAQAEVQRHEAAIAKLTATLAELKTALATAQATQAEDKDAIAELKRLLAEKTTQLDKATAELAKQQKAAKAATTALAAAQGELKALKAQYEAPKPAPSKDGLVFVKGGTFEMGDVLGDKEYDDETAHRVTLNDFYIGQYAVTFAEYDRFCEAAQRDKPTDQGWGRDQRPVINVSWYDVIAYCNWLSEQHGLTPYYSIDKTRKDPSNGNKEDELKWAVTPNQNANGYRLPTEAEWEYAAREGGKEVRFGNGKSKIDPKEINFNAGESYKKDYSVVGEYRGKTVPVGSLNSPNALGLHDMSGNVWEWCWDWYGSYPTSAPTNPLGADKGVYRVFRGGSWLDYPRHCRVAYRSYDGPTYRVNYVGFRLARS